MSKDDVAFQLRIIAAIFGFILELEIYESIFKYNF